MLRAAAEKPVGRGTYFVVIGPVVELPVLAGPVCLPVTARLWRPGQEKSKVDIAASMLRFLAACHDGRRPHVVADAAYHGESLRDLPAHVTYLTRLPTTAVLYALAPHRTDRPGRPALKGERLGAAKELAATADFASFEVGRYRHADTVFLAEVTCLWQGSFHTRTVRLIIPRGDATDTGYDLALVTTDLATPAPE